MDGLLNFFDLGADRIHLRNVVSLTREGVTDLLDFVSDVVAVPEYYYIY